MKMKLLQKKGSSLAAMFTAVVIACLGLTQRGEAVFVFSILDSDTFTIAASGSSLNGSVFYGWGAGSGPVLIEYITSSSVGSSYPTGGNGANSPIFYEGGLGSPSVTGVQLSDGFGSGGFALPDGGVYTFANTDVDLTTLVLPSSPLSQTIGMAGTSGADNSMVFVDFVTVPEPSSAICLGVGFCSLLLRRKRA